MTTNGQATDHAFGLQSIDSFLFDVHDLDFDPPEPPGRNDNRGQDPGGRGLGIAGDATDDDLFAGGPDGPETPDLPDAAPFGAPPPSLIGASGLAFFDGFAAAKPDNGKGKPPKDDPDDDPGDDPYITPTSFWSPIFGEEDAGGTDYYNIKIEFYGDAALWGAVDDGSGGYTGGFIDAFLGSAQFLTSMIKYGYADSYYDGPYPDIEAGETGEYRWAEDLVIEAYLTDIDGVGGTLGRAGPYDLPDADGNDVYEGFPTAGLMEFDVADAGNLLSGAELGGLWNDVLLHEMMHVVGFGTLWDQSTEGDAAEFEWDTLVGDTLYYTDNGTRRPNDYNYLYTYHGAEANRQAEGDIVVGPIDGEYYLAVEADGGGGTARGHWDEIIYGNEIMTGYINSNNEPLNFGANYLSDFTVGAFTDLGYILDTPDGSETVDYDAIAASGTHFLETGEFKDWSEFVVEIV